MKLYAFTEQGLKDLLDKQIDLSVMSIQELTKSFYKGTRTIKVPYPDFPKPIDIEGCLHHSENCNINQNWTEALDALSRIPEKLQDDKWKDEVDRIEAEMNKCTCAVQHLNKLLKTY